MWFTYDSIDYIAMPFPRPYRLDYGRIGVK
jgi:hypothetical protein